MTPTNNDAAIVLEALVHQPRDWLEAKQALDRLAAAAERTDEARKNAALVNYSAELARRTNPLIGCVKDALTAYQQSAVERGGLLANKEHDLAVDAREALDALVAELDRAEAALLVAQQELADERGRQTKREAAAYDEGHKRAEATITRLREALRLATYAFAQYAEERNDPSDEAVEGFMDGFMQDADLRRLASDAEQEPEGREGIVTVYDHHNRYLGCMGIERWRELLASDAEQENA